MLTAYQKKERRKKRVSRKVRLSKRSGNLLRLSIFRSNNHMHAQIIDDNEQKTITAASTVEKDFKAKNKNGGNVKAAQEIGKLIAKRANDKGIKAVVFDRGPYLYHGRIKEVAESARKNGLKI